MTIDKIANDNVAVGGLLLFAQLRFNVFFYSKIKALKQSFPLKKEDEHRLVSTPIAAEAV